MSTPSNYTLSVGAEGANRLKVLNQVCNPATLSLLDKIGSIAGQRVMDLGCGTGIMTTEFAKRVGSHGCVIAVDMSTEQLELAKQHARQENLSNIEFVELSAEKIDTLTANFDLIYCRFVLMHLKDARTVLQKMAKLLKPGGRLICEEAIGQEPTFSYPTSKVFAKWKKYTALKATIHDTDFTFGLKLHQLFAEYGLTNIELRLNSTVLATEEEKQLLWRGIQESVPALTNAGLATEQELNQLIADLKIFAKEKFSIAVLHFMQTTGVV